MKKHILLLLLSFLTCTVHGQIISPVKWAYGEKRLNPNEVLLLFKATIDYGWHIYSVNQKNGGPQKTIISFFPSPDYTINGIVQEPLPVIHYEKVFGMDVEYFEESVIFKQRVRLKKDVKVIKGKINFMPCNDHQCLPPDSVSFAIPIK